VSTQVLFLKLKTPMDFEKINKRFKKISYHRIFALFAGLLGGLKK
jgi:hypothetical protein